MALKAHLRNSSSAILLVIFCLLFTGCGEETVVKVEAAAFEAVDISKVPDRNVAATDPKLILTNGIYYFGGHPFSGFVTDKYDDGTVKFTGSYFLGKQHGVSRTWYPDGTLRDERCYKANVSYGRHVGFWENGKPKFDFFYVAD